MKLNVPSFYLFSFKAIRKGKNTQNALEGKK